MNKIILTTFLFIFFLLPVNAVDNDLGLWTAINLNVPVTEKVLTKFLVSPRWLDNATDFNQLILHGLLGYKLTKNVSIFQGYAWSTTYIPHFKREQRLYNDLLIENKFKKLSLENRVRFEERFLQGVEGTVLRARYRIKGNYPINRDEKWNLVLYYEPFVNIVSHAAGRQSGLDQNRFFIGLNRKINKYTNIEGGYLMQYINIASPKPDRLNHHILVNLYVNLPQLIGEQN